MHHQKASYLALLLAVVALSLVIARPTDHEQVAGKKETAFERVMRTHTLRCGYAMWNPILYKDVKSGELRGIAHDVIEAVGKKLDLRIEWAEETGWGTLVEGLATHRYDAICNALGVVPARAKAIDFSVPLFFVPSYIVVRQDEQRFARNDDLNNSAYSFAILEGEAASFLVREKFPQARLRPLAQNTDFTLVFQEVETRKADATLITAPDFVEYQKANPGKLKILDQNPTGVYPAAFGLPQGDVALKAMIDATLGDVVAEGVADKILNAYSQAPDEFLKPLKPYELPSMPSPKNTGP